MRPIKPRPTINQPVWIRLDDIFVIFPYVGIMSAGGAVKVGIRVEVGDA